MLARLKEALNCPTALAPPSDGTALEGTSRQDKMFLEFAVALKIQPGDGDWEGQTIQAYLLSPLPVEHMNQVLKSCKLAAFL